MIKTLAKHGNSKALVLEKPILDLLNIDDHTALEITTDGVRLIVTPVDDRDDNRRKKFAKGLEEGHKKLGKALSKVTDK